MRLLRFAIAFNFYVATDCWSPLSQQLRKFVGILVHLFVASFKCESCKIYISATVASCAARAFRVSYGCVQAREEVKATVKARWLEWKGLFLSLARTQKIHTLSSTTTTTSLNATFTTIESTMTMPSSDVRSPTATTPSTPYIRVTVERSIHRHRVVIFGRNVHCRLTNHLQTLLDDTPGTPFLSHEIKVYYLEDLPAQREIEGELRVLASASIQRKKERPLHSQKHSHNHEDRQPDPKVSPPQQPRAFIEDVTTIDSIPCYVFVSGVFLSYKEIQDLFQRIAPKDSRTKAFVEFLQSHEYHNHRLVDLPMEQHSNGHDQHLGHTPKTHHKKPHYHPLHGLFPGHSSLHKSHHPRTPSTSSSSSSGSNSPTYSKRVLSGSSSQEFIKQQQLQPQLARPVSYLPLNDRPRTPKANGVGHRPYHYRHQQRKSPPLSPLDKVMEE
jgi:hypothetical protein